MSLAPEYDPFLDDDKLHVSSGNPEGDPYQGKSSIDTDVAGEVAPPPVTVLPENLASLSRASNLGNGVNMPNVIDQDKDRRRAEGSTSIQPRPGENNMGHVMPDGRSYNQPNNTSEASDVTSSTTRVDRRPRASDIIPVDQPKDNTNRGDSSPDSSSSSVNKGSWVTPIAGIFVGYVALQELNNNLASEVNAENSIDEVQDETPVEDNTLNQPRSDDNNGAPSKSEGRGDEPPVGSKEGSALPISGGSDVIPGSINQSNNQPIATGIGGGDQPKANSDESDSILDSSITGGSGGEGGDKLGIANISSLEASPSSTKHFLNEILDYHGYTTSMVHRSLENRLNLQAIAAGDDSQRVKKGLWAKGIVGNAIEQKSSSSAGYKANFHGFTVGADAEFYDDLLLGVAFSNILSRIKFKEQYSGDKVSSNTKTASLYGMKNITSKVYVSATGSLTQSDTKASYLQTNTQGQQFLAYQERKNVRGGFIDARVHYMSTLTNGMILTPFLGMNYSKNALPGFSENDSDGLPFAVASLKNERTNVMVGTSLSLRSYSAGKLKISPKINASVNQQIHSKISSIKLTDSNGNLVEIKNNDKNKTTLGLGGSVGVSYKNTDVLVAYDAQVRNNFVGQQVSLKVRVNF